MAYRTTRTNLRKIYNLLSTWLRATLLAIGEQVFATTDADAHHHGWQVTFTHGGLGRRYRDPRFGTLAACTYCSGRGVKAPGNPCRSCSGTGRIVVEAATRPPSSSPPRGLT
jgi:hypothetical protein